MVRQNSTYFRFSPGKYELKVSNDPSTLKIRPGFDWAIHTRSEVYFIGDSGGDIKKENWFPPI